MGVEESPLEEGIRHMVCFQLKEAAESFDREGEKPGHHTFALVLQAEALFLKAAITEGKKDMEDAFSKLQLAEASATAECELGKHALVGSISRLMRRKEHKEPSLCRRAEKHWGLSVCACLAFVYLMQALLHFRTASASAFVAGSLKLNSSWRLYKQLAKNEGRAEPAPSCNDSTLKDDGRLVEPETGDVYFGMGGFQFFLSLVPSGFQWLVSALGFRSGEEEGVAALERSLTLPGTRGYAALLLLIWINAFFYNDRPKAERLFRQATDRYEDAAKGAHSPLFQYLGGYLARLQGKVEIALERFKCAQEASAQVHPLKLMCEYEIGWCWYLRCDFERAVVHFVRFLAEFQSPSYRAFCAYQLGTALDILGRREEAVAYMQKVEGYVRKNFSFDTYAARKARQYIAAGRFSAFEHAFVALSNKLELQDFARAAAALPAARQALAIDSDSQEELPLGAGVLHSRVAVIGDETALFEYCRGRTLKGLREVAAARDCFENLVRSKKAVTEELYIIPHALCEVAELRLEQGDRLACKEAIKEADRFDNFEFDKPLMRRLRVVKGNLKKLGVEADARRSLP